MAKLGGYLWRGVGNQFTFGFSIFFLLISTQSGLQHTKFDLNHKISQSVPLNEDENLNAFNERLNSFDRLGI